MSLGQLTFLALWDMHAQSAVTAEKGETSSADFVEEGSFELDLEGQVRASKGTNECLMVKEECLRRKVA